jgi:hypothetical protein
MIGPLWPIDIESPVALGLADASCLYRRLPYTLEQGFVRAITIQGADLPLSVAAVIPAQAGVHPQ